MGRQRGGHDGVEYYVNMFGVLSLQIAAKRSCFYSCSATSDTLVHFLHWFADQILVKSSNCTFDPHYPRATISASGNYGH